MNKTIVCFFAVFVVISVALLVYQPLNQTPTIQANTLPAVTPPPSSLTNNSDTSGGELTLFALPEFGMGGGLIALVACFIAFGLLTLRRKKSSE